MKKILSKILCSTALSIIMISSSWAWPTKPVTIVVTSTPGAASDQIARGIQTQLSEKLGVPIVIAYKPGGDTAVGTRFVVHSDDNHTILLSSGQISSLKNPVGDHTLDNLKAISIVAVSPSIVTTASDSKVANVKQMLSAADLTSGAAAGTVSEFLIKATNKSWTYVGYKGGVPMFTDLIAKHIDLGANSAMGSYTYINGGRLKPLMVFSKSRMAQFPEVPTSYELDIPLSGEVWFGFLGNRSMSDSIINRLSVAINDIVKEPKLFDQLTRQGATVLALGPVASQRYIEEDLKNLTKIYKDSIK
jgi:tripartite-type tricarboxylate transporter receptor subunit TctC